MNRSTPSGANWQDVYVVGQWTGGSTFDNVPGIFGGTTGNNSDNGVVGGNNSGAGLWFSNWTDDFYINGTTNNGSNVVSTMSSPFLISFSKNSAVSITGYQVGADRTIGGREWKGHFGEVIAFGTKLPDTTRQKVEGYLAHKWGLTSTLPGSHPYKSSKPLGWNPSLQASENLEASAESVGVGKEGFYGTTISGLTAGETYYYRLRSQGRINPKSVSGANLKLWLDASKLSTSDATWNDLSGNGNHAAKNGSPSVVANAQNGLSVMHYTGNGQRHKFNMITDIRTVFWVISIDQAYSSSGFRYVLSDSSKHPHWHNNNNGKLFWGHSNTHVRNASTRLNGTTVNGSNTNQPTSLSILSVKTTGDVHADQFGYDRSITSRQWIGKLGELIIYNSDLSDSDIVKVEGYLAHKWGLTSTLPSTHAYKTSPALSQTTWSSVQSFTTPTNVTAPVLGSLGTANLTKTTADLEATLSDNGNAATSLVFYWGDNDAGTNPSSWDSNFTVSNAQEGTLRKSLTGLTGGTTYYFRAYASNWKGNSWASTTRSFTTVTSTTRDTPVRNADLKGWWKFDGDLQDSSGNKNHATGAFIWNPTMVPNINLWVDASDTSTIATVGGTTDVDTWANKLDPTVKLHGHSTNKPSTGSVINGLNAIHFDRRSDNNIEHIFAKKNGSSNWNPAGVNGVVSGKVQDVAILMSARLDAKRRSTFAFGMGWGDHFPWNNGQVFWKYSDARANVTIGNNGDIMLITMRYSKTNGKQEIFLNGKSILDKPRTNDYGTGNMSAFTFPATHSPGGWGTEWTVGEIIAIGGTLNDVDRQRLEGYLAHKWGLGDKLPGDHANKIDRVEILGDSPFSNDVATGTGQSFDLSNGTFATISTGGTEDIFDGDSNFTVSLWMKGWPDSAGESIVNKDHFTPSAYGDIQSWLDSSVSSSLSKDSTGTLSANGDVVYKWNDLSGNGHHAITYDSSPVLNATGFNSKPTVAFTNDTMVLEGSDTSFAEWANFTIIMTWKVPGGHTWTTLLGRAASNNTFHQCHLVAQCQASRSKSPKVQI